MLRVVSPVAGHSVAVSDIPDPVFSRGIVGPGAAIRPREGRQVAFAPVAGTLAKLLPHAFVIVTHEGPGVLVHLGVDTVHMQGEGFELLAREGERVAAGDRIVAWDPASVEATGRSTLCAVVVLDCEPGVVELHALDRDTEPGDLLFEVTCSST